MSLPFIAALTIVCVPAVVRADRAIVAEVAPVAPFDADQLAAAIRLRIPAEGAPVRVRVSATPEGVRIEAHGNVREVTLRGLTGAAAARFVALAADDLLLDDLARPPLGPPSLTASTAPRRASTTIGLLGGAAAWPRALGALGVDLAIPAGEWLVAIDAGGATLVDGPLRLTAAVLRVGGGTRVGWLELRAGATVEPVIVTDGDGDRTVLAGAGASARLRVPLAGNVRAVLAAGLDVFATRTTYVSEGMAVLSTPRGAPWFAVGVEVAP